MLRVVADAGHETHPEQTDFEVKSHIKSLALGSLSIAFRNPRLKDLDIC